MLEAKAPDFDACGLFRAVHSYNPAQYSHIVGLKLHFCAHIGMESRAVYPFIYGRFHVGLDLLALAHIQKKWRCFYE